MSIQEGDAVLKKSGYAFFVKRPRTLEDLISPHLLCREQAYELVESVALAAIDYENFITDMLADRQFFEDKAALCSRGEVWKCLFIYQAGKTDGVLAIPESDDYLGWAAYICD